MSSLRRSGEFRMPVPGSAAEASVGEASSITTFAHALMVPRRHRRICRIDKNRDGETAVAHGLVLEKNHAAGRFIRGGRTANA